MKVFSNNIKSSSEYRISLLNEWSRNNQIFWTILGYNVQYTKHDKDTKCVFNHFTMLGEIQAV